MSNVEELDQSTVLSIIQLVVTERLEDAVADLSYRLDEVEGQNQDFGARLDEVNARVDDVENDVADIQSKLERAANELQ